MTKNIEIISTSPKRNPLLNDSGLLVKNVPGETINTFLICSVNNISKFLDNVFSPIKSFVVEVKYSDGGASQGMHFSVGEIREVKYSISVQFVFHTAIGGMGASVDVERNKMNKFYNDVETRLKSIIAESYLTALI